MSDQSQDEIICSITLEPIVDAGMTCFGSIYEYSAITEWLSRNDTDPLTGQYCPTKFVRRIDTKDKNLPEIIKDARLSLELWSGMYRTFAKIPSKYERKLAICNKFNLQLDSDDVLLSSWKNYNLIVRERFLTENNTAYFRKCGADDTEIVDPDRPKDSGSDLDFIDLSRIAFIPAGSASNLELAFMKCTHSVRVTKHRFSFKSQDFNFNNLSNCIFINCDFSRCTFIGCNLSNIIFDECTFIGEEVCFYKSYGTNIKFTNCKFEYVDKWQTTTDVKQAAEILKCRHLSGQFKLSSSENKILVSIEK